MSPLNAPQTSAPPPRLPPSNTAVTLDTSSRALLLPLCAGRASAGFPSPATDHIDQCLDLTRHLVLHPEATFFLRVKGDSMTGAGIHDGDLLIVDRSLEPASGRVIVAALNGGELAVKRLQRSRGRIVLKSENPAYADIPVNDGHDLQIWGVVVYVVHAP
jgi:DNA polymerase V